jgi:uncharacterized protein YndB with AHSA1/START domain
VVIGWENGLLDAFKMMEPGIVFKTVRIDAGAEAVWAVLTEPELIRQWVSDDELEVLTDWAVGGAVVMRGDLHGLAFENKGKVLECEPGKLLRYTYLSSLSKLPDRPQNYSVIEFRLKAEEGQTVLTLTQSNFVTITNYKHFDFYWNVTMRIIKRLAEE